MNAEMVCKGFSLISEKIRIQKEYLTMLDQQTGDGDLGISMERGFLAIVDILSQEEDTDIGRIFLKAARILNETSPSSLGTILSILFMGTAKALQGQTEISIKQLGLALEQGMQSIMEKTGSNTGEKTVLDALSPAIAALVQAEERAELANAAAEALKGAEATRQMLPVHGRAAYFAEKGIGKIDGGAEVCRLAFEALAEGFPSI